MTAATITNYIEVANPNIEVVQLTASDGETYTSKKFSVVAGVLATGNADVDAYLNAVPTNGTAGAPASIAINYASQTDKLITLVIFGKLGN